MKLKRNDSNWPIKYPIWIISWKDAVYRFDSEADPNVPLHCEIFTAIGFVIRNDEKAREIEFVQEFYEDGTVRHRNVISYEMILEYKVLSQPREPKTKERKTK